ncbi:MAG: hypothetical protein AB8H79_08560, partial [Myxococcota bacterium]
MRPLAFALVLSALSACGSPAEEGTPIRATLDEDQILVGEVHTGFLVLEGGLGTLDIPLEDVGEVEPVEGTDLAGSGDHVRVWLRNGSELVGRWAKPSVAVDIEIGGAIAQVDLPMDDVQRLQLEGQSEWPEDGIFRVTTSFGDDLFINAAQTRLPLQTDLGAFSPFLDEVASVVPLDGPAGRWRVELQTGTVLVATIASDSLNLALPAGPEFIDVPL